MNQKTLKLLFAALIAALLFAAAAVCAYAVPALPGAGYTGEAAACRSHHGALVTLDTIPARQSDAKNAPSIVPAEKNIPLLTVVIGFTNMPYQDDRDWNDEMFSGPKSLSAYYTDMSFGKFTFTPATETSAYGKGGNTNAADKENDGVVHVKLSAPHKDWAHENEYPAMGQALAAAIEAADAYVDFSAYDYDENGRITENELALGFVVAGYEGAAGISSKIGADKYLWAHAWTFSELLTYCDGSVAAPTPDGTAVDAYIAIAEQLNETEPEPISVLAHELGHYIGLPDLYDTSDNPSAEWGKYDVAELSVMSSGAWGDDPDGGYIPYSMDIWSRFALGWCTPVTAAHDGTFAVNAQSYAQDEAFASVLVPTAREKEYYLLENRQFTKWDAGLAKRFGNGGILVWHIDDEVFEQYFESNQVNDTFHRPGVMPLFPEYKLGGYTFTGSASKVYIDKAFFSASAWKALFGNKTTSLDLPLYGEGKNADKRAKRTLSGLKLQFLDNSGPGMTVRLTGAGHIHVLAWKEKTEPTCTEPGVSAHWECTVCGAPFTDDTGTQELAPDAILLPAQGHDFGEWAQKSAPGCETQGVNARVCARCGEEETEPIPAAGHRFEVYMYNDNASCTENGTETALCENGCGATDTREAPDTALGHDITQREAKEPTCTEPGWAAYEACTRCDYSTFETIPALGHDRVQHEARKPTCTEPGWAVYKTCTRCDYTTFNEIPAQGHRLVPHEAKSPTCTEPGWAAYDTCERCDYTTFMEIPAPGHDWGAWTVDRAARIGAAGIEKRLCVKCGAQQTREIPALSVMRGDVNGDGKITAADARLALRAAVKLEAFWNQARSAAFAAADADANGAVTAADARKILRAAVKLESF